MKKFGKSMKVTGSEKEIYELFDKYGYAYIWNGKNFQLIFKKPLTGIKIYMEDNVLTAKLKIGNKWLPKDKK